MHAPKIGSYKVPEKSIAQVRKYWLSLAFFFGFIVDNFTLNRVDQVFDNVILFSYVVLAMASLLVLYAGVAGKLPEKYLDRAKRYAPLAVQFAFGGLLSGMLIFYSRSGSWFESWPFLLIIVLVIYGNETITNRAQRLIYNLNILFIGLFSYVVLVIPVLTGKMGPWVFVGSGLLALFIMYQFMRLLHKIIPKYMALQERVIVFTLGFVFCFLNLLYFTNVIPPIPLSLKDAGIYHDVVRLENGDYELTHEDGAWWQFFKDSDDTFHPDKGRAVHCYASVFAPTKLATDIYHRYERFDDERDEWVTHGDRISYRIEGGRDGGFRGYTFIENYEDGEWRCTVETNRGQVLGRSTFEIDSTESGRELVTRVE